MHYIRKSTIWTVKSVLCVKTVTETPETPKSPKTKKIVIISVNIFIFKPPLNPRNIISIISNSPLIMKFEAV